ncbi:DUF1127 domain-containing protein [Stella sp.]|uniref:DUF1127 domain-containing protein n=1 Tax=Stella sp. TaxID=2912054 RepID=UPI0035B4C8DD
METHTPIFPDSAHDVAVKHPDRGPFAMRSWIARAFVALAAAAARRRELARSAQWLHGLDDRMLSDIGIRRRDIERLVHEPRSRFRRD